jgi:hypothetical protein
MKKITKQLAFIFIMLASQIMQAQIPTNGLIAFYPFCGNANDNSGNGHDGTVIGATLALDRFGNANSAYYFDGNGDTIILNLYQQNVTDYSISAWFQSDSGGPIVTGERDNTPFTGTRCLTLDLNWIGGAGNYGKVTFRADGPGVTIGQYTDSSYGDLNWHHVVGTYSSPLGQINPNAFLIYIDGHLVSSTPTASVYPDTANSPINNYLKPMLIGAHYVWSPSVFHGSLDDIRIYNRTIDSTEVLALYNEGLCYQTITVTDTLIINANLTGFNPIAYNNSIKIYPNPSNDHIIIDNGSNYNTLSGYGIRIENSLSQIVFSTSITQQIYTIDLNTWTGNGVYFIYYIDNLGHTRDVRKIVIQ